MEVDEGEREMKEAEKWVGVKCGIVKLLRNQDNV
jgi:hypothetical protein